MLGHMNWLHHSPYKQYLDAYITWTTNITTTESKINLQKCS